MGKPVNTAYAQYMHIEMGQDSVISDETLLRFNSQASSAYAATVDAPYRSGFGAVSLSTRSSDLVDLSINTLPLPKKQQEKIGLNIDAKANGEYNLTLKD